MSPSPGLAPGPGCGHSPDSASTNPTTAWPPSQWHRPGEPSSCRNRQFPVACPRADSVRIQARFMSETRLRLSSKTKLRQQTHEPASSTVLAQILHRLSGQQVGRRQQDGSRAWSSICHPTMRLPHPRSTVCTALGERKTLLLAIGHATGNLFSENGRRIFICARQSFGGGRTP